MFWSRSGTERMRLPVAAKMALSTAGAATADRRFADAAPEAARRHHDHLDLRHLADAHRVVGVEVRLLDGAVLYGAFRRRAAPRARYTNEPATCRSICAGLTA